MSKSEQALLSLLFEEGRVLENLKFFPGDNCTSEEDLFDAAHSFIRAALDGEGTTDIPVTTVKSVAIGDLVQAL